MWPTLRRCCAASIPSVQFARERSRLVLVCRTQIVLRFSCRVAHRTPARSTATPILATSAGTPGIRTLQTPSPKPSMSTAYPKAILSLFVSNRRYARWASPQPDETSPGHVHMPHNKRINLTVRPVTHLAGSTGQQQLERARARCAPVQPAGYARRCADFSRCGH